MIRVLPWMGISCSGRVGKGKQGSGVALYMLVLRCSMMQGGKPAEGLRVKVRGENRKDGVVFDVCYRLPSQEKGSDEAFFTQLTF